MEENRIKKISLRREWICVRILGLMCDWVGGREIWIFCRRRGGVSSAFFVFS
jgi:hypothetical protein